MDLVTLIGVVGISIVLIGFILNQFGRLTINSPYYDWLNIIGPSILVVYAWLLGSYPFLVLNVVWVVASIWSLISDGKKLN
jgi:hypothetical protein